MITKASIFINTKELSQAGFSLIELMISLALGAAVSWVILDVSLTSIHNSRDIESTGEVVEKGRYASDLLRREIKHAGFYGRRVSANMTGTPAKGLCTNLPSANNLLLPIVGLNDSPNSSQLCSGNNLLGDSDVLLIRRASTISVAPTSLTSSQHYIQSNFEDSVIGLGVAANFTLKEMDGTTLAPIRQLYQDVYYVDDDNNFKRRRLINGSNTVEPLIEGVDDFQLEYGIDTNDDNIADVFDTFPATWSDLENVKSVSVFLLVSSDGANSTDTKIYNYGDKSGVSFGDKRKRRLFSSVVAVGNQY